LLIYLFWTTACYAQAVSSEELIKHAKDFDGKPVVFRGEAIGDVMVRRENAWINVNDGQNAMGIWLNADIAKDINYTGGFKHAGDILEITGEFHHVCLSHGGDMDIHGQTLKIITPGQSKNITVSAFKKEWALRLLGVLAVVWILSLLKFH
jgi:hypothetical protein